MNRNTWIMLGAGAGLALLAIFFLRGGDSASTDGPRQGRAGASAPAHGDSSQDPNTRSTRDVRRRPRLQPATEGATQDVAQPQTYTRNDGSEVRDHRSNPPKPRLERIANPPSEISPIQPETLLAVRNTLRPAMKDCIANHAADAPEGAMAQAVLTVSISSENLKVDGLEFSTEGLEDDTEFRACVQSAMLGHQQNVAGSADVKVHTMTFPYKL